MDRLASMQTFVAVVDAGSFSAAARQLGVGQPAVSKSVAQLEDHLGTQLLLRSTRGLTPTESGQLYYEHARRAIEEADAAEHSARGASKGLSGRLRVSGAVTFSALHVVPHLQEFLDQHPQLSIDLVLDDRSIDLLEAGIDVTLRMGALADSSMTARRIAQSPRVVVATPAYLARCGEPQTPADLARHEAIIYGPIGGNIGSQAGWPFRNGSTEVSVVVAGRLNVSAAEGVRAAVLNDLGLAVTSEWMFSAELASGSVRRLLPGWTLPPLDLWAVFPAGRRASAKARAYVDFVAELLNRG